MYFKVLDFEPLLSDVHCGIALTLEVHEGFHRHGEQKVMTANLNAGIPWKWMSKKEEEYLKEINLDCIDDMIDDRNSMSVLDHNRNLTHLFPNPAFDYFPRKNVESI